MKLRLHPEHVPRQLLGHPVVLNQIVGSQAIVLIDRCGEDKPPGKRFIPMRYVVGVWSRDLPSCWRNGSYAWSRAEADVIFTQYVKEYTDG